MSLVVSYFSAAYSLNIAIQYPLLTPLICTVIGLLFKHHPLDAIGSIGGTALAIAVTYYYDWKPLSKSNTILTLLFTIISLYCATYGPLVVLGMRIISFALDMYTFDWEQCTIKIGFWGIGIVIYECMKLIFSDLRVDLIRTIKMDILIFGAYGLFMLLGLQYSKKEE